MFDCSFISFIVSWNTEKNSKNIFQSVFEFPFQRNNSQIFYETGISSKFLSKMFWSPSSTISASTIPIVAPQLRHSTNKRSATESVKSPPINSRFLFNPLNYIRYIVDNPLYRRIPNLKPPRERRGFRVFKWTQVPAQSGKTRLKMYF